MKRNQVSGCRCCWDKPTNRRKIIKYIYCLIRMERYMHIHAYTCIYMHIHAWQVSILAAAGVGAAGTSLPTEEN